MSEAAGTTTQDTGRPPGRRGRQGGAGGAGGVNFQARISAWAACLILAESDAAPLWGWPAGATLESVHAETGEAADDLLLTSAEGARAYLQAKLTLDLGSSANSEFAKTVAQFVSQFLAPSKDGGSFDLENRLVLAVGPEASGKVRNDLPRVLRRLAAARPGQALTDAAGNANEKATLAAFLGHARSAWASEVDSVPQDSELGGFAAQIRVAVLDLSEDGADVRRGQEHLRVSILREATQAGAAWSLLEGAGSNFAEAQTGADRAALQRLLTGEGLALRAAPSYRHDVDALRRQSRRALERMKPLSRITPPGGAPIRLERPALGRLRHALTSGSLLLTGEPGIGKSGLLFDLVESVRDEGREVVVLAAEALTAGSRAAVREELGLEHDPVEVLCNWPASGKGLLVIDGLDAARGEGSQALLLDLIAEAMVDAPDWRVLASIRRFDLRYNHKLRDLFSVAGHPPLLPEITSAEFASVRHFFLGELESSELAQLAAAAPELACTLEMAPQALRDLARVPFNLRLLAELVGEGSGLGELEPTTTQLELLDRHWQRRVTDGGAAGRTRVLALREVVARMLAGRAMQVARREVETATTVTSLTALLGDGLLAEQEVGEGAIEEEILSFSHNVLFDHAVERLRFRGDEGSMRAAIAADPDLLLLVRPSVEMHLRHLWEAGEDRLTFWRVALELTSDPEVPAIAKILAPTVAAGMVGHLVDLEPLLARLEDGSDIGVEELLGHLVAAAVGDQPSPVLRTAAGRRVFADLAVALSELDRREGIVAPLVELVSSLSAVLDRLGSAERRGLGRAARSLLDLALAFEHPQRALLRPAISAVVATYATDTQTSDQLLRHLIDPARVARSGYQELPDLCDEVEHLIASDPLLVRDIYIAAFDYEEDSKESTQVWQSQILGLTSTKSQDFGGARYQLGEAFPAFLSTAPILAVEALIAVRLAYARRRSSGPGIDRDVAIDWGAGETKILGDGSHFWDRNPLDHDEEVKMLGAFESRLDELAAAEDPEVAELLAALRSREVPAAIWRRVLDCARRSPETLTEDLVPLLRNPEALAERDLSDVIAAFLPAGLPLLEPVVREEIEAAIVGLPSTYGTRRPDLGAYAVEAGEHTRDELLGSLAPDDLLTAAASERASELQAASAERGTAPEDLPVGEWGATLAAARSEGGEEVVAIGELTERLRSFNDDHLNEVPLRASLEATAEPLHELWGVLASDHDGLPPDLRIRAFEEAARSAATAVCAETDDVPPSLLDLAGEVLLAAAAHPEPRPDAKRDENFDSSEGWSEAPRIQAAVGLLQLASLEGRAGEPVLAAIEALAADPVASVRAQVARRAFLLRTAAPELMWRIAEVIRDGDPSTAVRKALVRALPRMALGEGRRIGEFAEALYAGAPAEECGRALRNACVEILTDLYLYSDDSPAGAFLRERVFAEPGLHRDGARQAALQLRDTLVHGGEDPGHAALRARAIALAEFAVEAGAGELRRQLERVQQKGTAGDETDKDFLRLRGAAETLDTIAAEIYFASGVFQLRHGNPDPIDPDRRYRLYLEAVPVLDRLAEVPLARVAHRLVETLEGLIDFDPRGVFLRIARVIEFGREGRYQTETLAINVFVRVVERYLAEYRTLIVADTEMREALIAMLDTFVEAGWPQARRLTYGLHELFR